MSAQTCQCEQSEILIRPSGMIICTKCGLPFKPQAEKVPERP